MGEDLWELPVQGAKLGENPRVCMYACHNVIPYSIFPSTFSKNSIISFRVDVFLDGMSHERLGRCTVVWCDKRSLPFPLAKFLKDRAPIIHIFIFASRALRTQAVDI